ncbi:imm11 family protein [Myxococcus sp. 1LA]
MSYTYFTFKSALDPRAVQIVELPDKVERYFYLTKGRPVAPYLPPTTELSLYERAGDMLTDFIGNPDCVLYVSERAQQVLAARGLVGAELELLPFVLLDKRGRKLRESYCIANPLRSVPCVDRERSKYRLDGPDEIGDIRMLCVREGSIPDDAQLFRVAEFPEMMVLRSDLLEAFQQAGLTGLAVHPTGTEIPG